MVAWKTRDGQVYCLNGLGSASLWKRLIFFFFNSQGLTAYLFCANLPSCKPGIIMYSCCDLHVTIFTELHKTFVEQHRCSNLCKMHWMFSHIPLDCHAFTSRISSELWQGLVTQTIWRWNNIQDLSQPLAERAVQMSASLYGVTVTISRRNKSDLKETGFFLRKPWFYVFCIYKALYFLSPNAT